MKSTAKTVGLVMIIMISSRLLALISNQIYITYFGVSLYMDIYSYATQLPNIVFNSFGTAIATTIIPIFAGYIAINERQKAYSFCNNMLCLSFVFSLLLSLLGIIITPVLVKLTGFGVTAPAFAVNSLRIMFPVIIFYTLNYIFQGILQSLGKYNMPALVSIPSSLVVIAYVFTFGKTFGVFGLLIATLIGLSLQAIILIPPILSTDYKFNFSFNYKDNDVIAAARLIPPILIGTSAYQLNMLFNVTLSSKFENGATLITLVQNLILYAVLAFIFSITSVIYPKLTVFASKDDIDGFKKCLINVLKSIIFFIVPASIGFIAIRYELIDFIYGWGNKITKENIHTASIILCLYSVGLIGVGFKEVLDRAFYSLKDTKKPAINGIFMMVINIIISLSLVYFIGLYAIPTAYSISSILAIFILIFMLRAKIGSINEKILLISAFKVLISSAIMFIAIFIIKILISNLFTGIALLDKSIKLFFPVFIGVFIYALIAYLLKLDEAYQTVNKIKSRLVFLKLRKEDR